MREPNSRCSHLFQQPNNLRYRNIWRVINQQVNMILINFHYLNSEVLCLIGQICVFNGACNPRFGKKLLSVLNAKDNVAFERIFSSHFVVLLKKIV